MKPLITALLLTTSLAAQASDYYVVVPVKGRTSPAPDPVIAVTLNSASLPTGTVGIAYSVNLADYLLVTGDSSFTGSNVTWTITSGTLPPGLTFNGMTGRITGTPTDQSISSLTVEASYKTKTGSQTYPITIKTVANLAATQAGATIGNSKPDMGSTTDAYFGPNAYSLSMGSTTSWSAIGALVSDTASLNSHTRPVKSNSSASTFRGTGSAAAPFSIVVDLGRVRNFSSARYYQTFSDGKATHAALDVSTTGNLETRTSANWREVHGWTMLDDSSTSDGVAANFPTQSARYLRIRLYNSGIYGSTSYTELYSFKLFDE